MSSQPSKYKIYITFGQIHKHIINGIELDKDTVAEITFNDIDSDESIVGKTLEYYPKGIVNIDYKKSISEILLQLRG